VTKLLVIEDDTALGRALRILLEAHDYDVVIATTGGEGLTLAERERPDAIILDLYLPDMAGVMVATALRHWTDVPIVALSAGDTEAAKVAALDAGADDYVTKPFVVNEFLARLRAVLRRTTNADASPVVVTNDFTIDLRAKQVRGHDGEIRLTPTQWQIVERLVRHPGRLVTQQELLQQGWGPDHEDKAHYLRVYISQIRTKLEPEPSRPRYFITEPGMGYRFDNADTDSAALGR
jgi:two-component system KDP operon response regulator KdpE